MSECLHCEINELVQERIEQRDPVDVMDLAGKMVESLVEVILLAPETDQAKPYGRCARAFWTGVSREERSDRRGGYDALNVLCSHS